MKILDGALLLVLLDAAIVVAVEDCLLGDPPRTLAIEARLLISLFIGE